MRTTRGILVVEPTQQQTERGQHRARELSLERQRPPRDVPGYQIRRFLGSGAYGEVWVAVDENTGRQVAIKFYLHRGGLDWSLLSREVDTLVRLSADRYVVQLLEVGWESSPPFYVMEFIESGSLEDLLQTGGPLPVEDATKIFREIAVALGNAHAKGVLHCDLKPANVLLDGDRRPRLADFGQSRLSHEQSPALGTLFYMAPEQADLKALPDARWDVYALGAVFYAMLTGNPPHRGEEARKKIDSGDDLEDRLARYRAFLSKAPAAAESSRLPPLDSGLRGVLARCLAVDPERRFASVQSVVDALEERDEAIARWPLMILGLVGPALLLSIITLFGWWINHEAVHQADQALVDRALEANQFASQFVAETAANRLESYLQQAEEVAADPLVRETLAAAVTDPEVAPLLARLAEIPSDHLAAVPERQTFLDHPLRLRIQKLLQGYMFDSERPAVDSWFVTDKFGTQVASVFREGEPERSPIGRNFAWRTYFHGGRRDLEVGQPHSLEGRLAADRIQDASRRSREPRLSAVFNSTANGVWKVAISAPVYEDPVRREGFLGVLALTVELGDFVDFKSRDGQFPVLVDNRPGEFRGVILAHPLFDRWLAEQKRLPANLSHEDYRIRFDAWENGKARYIDPLGAFQGEPDKVWLAARSEVQVRRGPLDSAGRPKSVATGLVVVMQEDYDAAIEPVHELGWGMYRLSLIAVGLVVAVITGLWYWVLRSAGTSTLASTRAGDGDTDRQRPSTTLATLPQATRGSTAVTEDAG